jgi:hypothetical protein
MWIYPSLEIWTTVYTKLSNVLTTTTSQATQPITSLDITKIWHHNSTLYSSWKNTPLCPTQVKWLQDLIGMLLNYKASFQNCNVLVTLWSQSVSSQQTQVTTKTLNQMIWKHHLLYYATTHQDVTICYTARAYDSHHPLKHVLFLGIQSLLPCKWKMISVRPT